MTIIWAGAVLFNTLLILLLVVAAVAAFHLIDSPLIDSPVKKWGIALLGVSVLIFLFLLLQAAAWAVGYIQIVYPE